MKTEKVVLRKVTKVCPELFLWNFALNPHKWSNVRDGQYVVIRYYDGTPCIGVFFDISIIQAVMPIVYAAHLALRALKTVWVVAKDAGQPFEEWLIGRVSSRPSPWNAITDNLLDNVKASGYNVEYYGTLDIVARLEEDAIDILPEGVL